MAKDDKELGKWIATSIVNGLSIKRYDKGFSFKKRGESITFKDKFPEGTTTKQMSDYMAQAALQGTIAR